MTHDFLQHLARRKSDLKTTLDLGMFSHSAAEARMRRLYRRLKSAEQLYRQYLKETT